MAMNPLVNEKIRVRIYGKDYEMDPGGLTPLEANQLAYYVDQKMKEIADKLNIVDTQKIAVLASLNIAFELTMKKEKEKENLSKEDQLKIEKMITSLDNTLKSKSQEKTKKTGK